MQRQHDEKLSLLIDDQLDRVQAAGLLKAMKGDSELEEKWRRYHLISQALKNDRCSTASSNFADKVHQQLRDEPIHFLASRKPTVAWQKTVGLAVAASVALVAVIIFGTVEKNTQPIAGINTVARQVQVPQTDPMNARFKEYLQAHDNGWYVNNNVGVQQYARLAGYQGK